VRPTDAPEPPPDAGEAPEAYAVRAATVKARAASRQLAQDPDLAGAVVVAADTVVCVDQEILGKPTDAADAVRMLTVLSGREHVVATGVCLARLPRQMGGRVAEQTLAVLTAVNMPTQDLAALAAYVATGEPMDKAGAYAIQGKGAFLVDQVQGSYTNVVGLPLHEVLAALLAWRAIAPAD
jgi:septum formation protein